jgi:Fe-S cluster biogenesis protein NfuA
MRARLLTAALAFVVAACDATEALRYAPVAVCLRVEQPSEQVFRTAEEWAAFVRRHGGAASVPSFDFGTTMVAAHFDGTGSACVGFTVESVEATDDEIVVQATRHTSPDPCIAVLAYPQLVIAVDRRDLPVRFRIRDVSDRMPGVAPSCV